MRARRLTVILCCVAWFGGCEGEEAAESRHGAGSAQDPAPAEYLEVEEAVGDEVAEGEMAAAEPADYEYDSPAEGAFADRADDLAQRRLSTRLGRTGGLERDNAQRAFGGPGQASNAPRAPSARPVALPSPSSPPRRRAQQASELTDPWDGQGAGGSGNNVGRGYGAPVAAAPTPLPQSGVLSNNFVGGRGAQARLEDLLDRGVMVGNENVRLEAFDELGQLPYGVPAQEAVALYAELERGELLEEGERVHMQIALMAHRGEAPPRPRMDIRLVFDRSGSMMGEKWTHAIAAAHQLVDRLEAGDTFGLVSYSDTAALDFRPQRVGNGRSAHNAIDALRPGGGTNIESALTMVGQNAPHRRAMNDVLLVVLISDGVANIGQTNAQELGSMARGIFDDHGALTTAVGLGVDFDEETMLSIAREGSGSYHFVRRAADIGDILTDELQERALAVAQALRLRIELGPGVVATRVYGSQVLDEQQERAVRRTEIATDRRLAAELGIARDRQRDEDRGLRIHLPTFRRADQHVVLMELHVPPNTATSQIAHVTLDYKDLLARRNRTTETDVEATRTRDRQDAIASTNRPVKRTVLAFQAGDALRGASDALQRGDLRSAQTLLAERRELLVAASDLWNDRALARDADLLSRYERVLGAAWNNWDSQSRSTMMLAMNFYGGRRMQ